MDQLTASTPRLSIKRLGARCLRVCSAVVLLTLSHATVARADETDVIPTVAIPCQNCVSVGALQAEAETYLKQWLNRTPPGYPAGKHVRPCTEMSYDYAAGEPTYALNSNCTVAIVVSIANPVSGAFLFDIYDYATNAASVVPQSLPDTLAAMDYDNRMFARASKTPTIELPAHISSNETPEIIARSIEERFVLDPGSLCGIGCSSNLFHFFTHLPDIQLVSYEFVHLATMQRFKVYVGGTITVRYPNGQTEKFKFVNFASQVRWQRVEGTLRNADGSKPNGPNEYQGSIAVDPATISIPVNSNGTNMWFELIPVYTIPGSRIERRGYAIVEQLPTLNMGMTNKVTYQQ